MPRSRTRARNRTIDKSADPAWPRARRAQLYREVIRRMKKLLRTPTVRDPNENAPDPATGGVPELVSPARELEPEALADVPVRRGERRTGVTVLTD